MGKNFVKEYFQIAKSLGQLIEDISLLTEDCAKLAQESTFGDAAVMKLEALGMPMAEALAALTDAVYMEDMKAAESWLNAADEEIGMDEVEDTDDTDCYDDFEEFIKDYATKTYRVVNSYFEAESLNITLRIANENFNRYIRVTNHNFTDPRQWYQSADINSDGYHAANVGEALTAALTSGDLGYIGGGPCDGVE